MVDGIKMKKGQTGIYLSVPAKHLLINLSRATGLTMSMVVETALREYSFNHREEIKFYDEIVDKYRNNF